MVVNRANSGVSVADMERTVGMPALALIRSGGLLFVRAANEGRTVIEMFPKEKIATDFDVLADALSGRTDRAGRRPRPACGFRLVQGSRRGLAPCPPTPARRRRPRAFSSLRGPVGSSWSRPAEPPGTLPCGAPPVGRSFVDLFDPSQVGPVDEDVVDPARPTASRPPSPSRPRPG